MQEQRLTHEEMMSVILANWHGAVIEGEEKYAREDCGTVEQFRRIKEYAQHRIVHELVRVKDAWLTRDELDDAYEMFDDLSSSLECFKLIEINKEYERKLAEENLFRRLAI